MQAFAEKKSEQTNIITFRANNKRDLQLKIQFELNELHCMHKCVCVHAHT